MNFRFTLEIACNYFILLYKHQEFFNYLHKLEIHTKSASWLYIVHAICCLLLLKVDVVHGSTQLVHVFQ